VRTRDQKVWYLQRLNLFAGLSPADAEGLSRALNERVHMRGEKVLGPDSPGDLILLVRSGKVRIYSLVPGGRRTTAAVLRPGNLFGTSASIGVGERRRFAAMLEDGVICGASVDEFIGAISGHQQCSQTVIAILMRQFLRLEQQVTGPLAHDVPALLAQLLLQLAEDLGGQLPERLTHGELAQFIGTSRETVTRTLNQFAERGLVMCGYRQLEILNARGLRREAGRTNTRSGRA
jgi:CRP/FNR family transcriptional regulator, cyclic AMP receptor protein